MTRAAPGIQLSVGRLRVDAAKAIAKLREYQLADHTAWVLEAIRAAVASGATKIELSGDANDVWLAWEGPAWPVDDLPRLFDELVSPEPTSERHHLRLLAAAVNSALGMNPAYVDVFAIDETPVRVRYTPDVLEETTEDGESALRAVAAVAAAPPAGVGPSTGMLVHLRRRTAFGMLTYLFWERRPAELVLAAMMCRDIAVPLHVGGEVLCRKNQHGDLDRIPLGNNIDGFVALVDPDLRNAPERAALMEIAERGVVLATYTISVGPDTVPLAPVPLRLFIDAPRMPTNASRSQVRREAHPIADAEKQAPALAAELVTRLEKRLADAETPADRRAALALVASEIAGAGWESSPCTTYGKLAQLPLVRDAIGRPARVAQPWNLIYTKSEPLPPELAPWLGDVLWIAPGDPTARVVAGASLGAAATRDRIKWARRQHRAQRAFFDHTPREAKVRSKQPSRMRAKLAAPLAPSCVPDAEVAGLTGEVCVFPARTTGALTLLLKGREIETVTLDANGIGFEAVVDSERLLPTDRYRAVLRDESYARIAVGVQFMIVRAVEAIALQAADQKVPDDFTAGTEPSDDDARLVRQAIELALDLGAPVTGPLATAKVWRTTAGLASVYDLRLQKVLGIATLGTLQATPKHRVIVTAGSRERLAKLAPTARIVQYDTFRARGTDAGDLASRLAQSNRNALAVTEGELRGAIAPAGISRIRLVHLGVELNELPYEPKLLTGCRIFVDSDAIVPSEDWTMAADRAGLTERSFYEWELALARAAAQALVGVPPRELQTTTAVEVGSELGDLVCHVLGLGNAEALFGPDIIAELRRRPLLRALGHPTAVSIEEVATWFDEQIPYVDAAQTPVDDYKPIIASAATAQAFATLVGRVAIDGTATLGYHRRQAKARKHRAAHTAKSELPLVFTGQGPHIALDPQTNSLKARGVVGVGAGWLDIDVRIEGRQFASLRRSELPLAAIVELEHYHADETFEALQPGVVEQLAAAVQRATGPLLVHVAKTAPRLLGELGAVRTLFARWVTTGSIDRDTRVVLRDAAAWPSVRGGHVSIEMAAGAHAVVSVAEWQGDWLAPADGEASSAYDRDILQLIGPRGDVDAILTALEAAPLVDVTREVTKLQNERRMARGLIPAPALPHVPPPLKRKLRELGDAAKQLGLGEIGLVEAGDSAVLLHDHGRLRDRQTLDVVPPIHLAIEAPELVGENAPPVDQLDLGGSIAEQLRALRDTRSPATSVASATGLATQAQALAVALVADIVAKLAHDALPAAVRRGIARAVLARRIAPRDVAGVPILETVTGEWVPYERLLDQVERFQTIWVIEEGHVTQLRPLDETRIVFVMSPEAHRDARTHVTIADGLRELELDHTARKNRARPAATALELPAHATYLARVELDERDVRGMVGVLHPDRAAVRATFPHREMHPFDTMDDPCKWPTIAVIEDPNLTPDRTWSTPVVDQRWHAVQARIRGASERALQRIVQPPDNALANLRVNVLTADSVPELRGTSTEIRGVLWLVGAPCTGNAPAIRVIDAYVERAFTPRHDLGMAGTLYVHANFGWNADKSLEALCEYAHGQLVKELITLGARDPELVQAHVAHAIALSRVQPAQVPRMTFDCFRPRSIDSVALTGVLRGSGPQQIVGVLDIDGEGVVDDERPLSRVVIRALGTRGRRGRIEKPRPPVAPPIPPLPVPTPDPVPAPPRPPEPVRAHAIQNVVDAVRERLADFGVPEVEHAIADVSEPLLRYERRLRYAGDSKRLHAIANALRANSPWAPLAIDALVAHAIAVLDAALTTITPASQTHVLAGLFGTSS